MFTRIIISFIFLFGVISEKSFAAPAYSKTAGAAYRKLPAVKKKGTLYMRQLGNPKVLNPLINTDADVTDILGFVYARLMQLDHEKWEYYPYLAEKLDVSKDHKVLTYTLRKDAVWEDGSPITTDDVEFTFNTLMDTKVDAAYKRVYFEGYKFEKVDGRTFKFLVERPNVNTVNETNAGFIVIQKKQFANESNFNRSKGIMQPVSSGPYRVKSYSRDNKLELELKKDWWGFKIPEFKNQYNFENIVYRIIPDSALAYEKLIKGDLDVLVMNSETYGSRVKQSDREKFGKKADTKKALWANHFRTKAPAQWTYIAWNNRLPIFASKKTRQALAHLVNYDEITNKVYYGEGIRCISPFGSQTLNTAPDQKKRAFRFDPAKGLALLKADGWSDMDKTNTLSKIINGKKVKFEFTLRYNSENPLRAKIAQMVKEQFKRAGITVNVQALEFNTLIGKMDERDFEAIVMGWAKGTIYSDSKQIWHTQSFENKGSNFIGYSNPEVDALIEKASTEIDVMKHYRINQKIGSMIYDDQPYAFVVEIPGYMAGFNSNKVKAKKWALTYDDTPAVWMYSAE